MSLNDVTKDAVVKAIAEFDHLGRDQFLAKYGFDRSLSYFIRYNGQLYDSKAVAGAAHGFAVPQDGPLRATQFSGGERLNDRLQRLGFEAVSTKFADELDIDSKTQSVRRGLQQILERFPRARQQPFRTQPELWSAFDSTRDALSNLPAVRSRSTIKVDWSAGQGNWAKVPWVVLFDERETGSTQRGVYLVLLFRQDMSGVYITLNQGVTQPRREFGARGGRDWLRRNVAAIQALVPNLNVAGFALDDRIDLHTEAGLGADYEVSTIAYKLYSAGGLPDDESIAEDVEALLAAYDRYLGQKPVLAVAATTDPPRENERVTLEQVVDEFASALQEAHISFGARHTALVRAFVASLATKRFAILTGLSGSGKTQIALRLGDWFGADRWRLEPVRPDWTGPESLFGFKDALQPAWEGRAVWQVPSVLEFILEASLRPTEAFLLILDEMNLAHVERYFADVLSGMEAETPVLPNVQRDADGVFRQLAGGSERLPFPRNVFVVGTVNVDETTYMFSPKVLDRANVFEFRVDTADLSTEYRKPVACAPGTPAAVAAFAAIAADDQWHHRRPAPGIDEFVRRLREIHAILSASSFEFGHRVFYEATRFASILAAAGENDPLIALDAQVLQKVLPRLHGSRRRVEPVLCALALYCYDGSISAGDPPRAFDPLAPQQKSPLLPNSFGKLQRMTQGVRANQFISFTD